MTAPAALKLDGRLGLGTQVRAHVELSVSVFVIGTEEKREHVRQQIAFYASTPSYRSVLALHGWGEEGQELSRLAARQRWEAMTGLVSDAMLEALAVEGVLSELAGPLRSRYQGLVRRLTPYRPFRADEDDAGWAALAASLSG